MADVVRDLVGQVEDEGEGVGGGLEAMRVGRAQDRQAGEVVDGAVIGGAAHRARAPRRAVDRFEIGAEDAAVVQRDPLRPVEQLAGAALERLASPASRCSTMARDDASTNTGGIAIGPPRRSAGSRPRACRRRQRRRERRGRSRSSLAHRRRRSPRAQRRVTACLGRSMSSGAGVARRRTTRRPAPARAVRAASGRTHRRGRASGRPADGGCGGRVGHRAIIRCADASISAY